MNAFLIGLLTAMSQVYAGPTEDCSHSADEWFNALEGAGCPNLERYRTAALTGCKDIPEDNWSREKKMARKVILQDCAPSPKGFPGAQATLADGTTSSRCSEMILLLHDETPGNSMEFKADMGVDRMMIAVGAGLFACHAPNEIDLCGLPSSVQTPEGQIIERRTACESLKNPPIDSTMRRLVWASGLLPVQPEERIVQLDELLVEQEAARVQHATEEKRFHIEREAEVVRARTLSDQCMQLPGEMTSAEQTEKAAEACSELEALWRGEDRVRKELETTGAIAARYKEQLNGKVLNAESLNAGDPVRVAGRPTVLEERRKDLIRLEFDALISSDTAAAEKLLEKYRALMGPEWAAEAVDRLLANGG
jgi:hypothetical protein